MTPPVGLCTFRRNRTLRKKTYERWEDGYGATDVHWPITPIKTASFAATGRRRSANNSREGQPVRSLDEPCRNWGSNGSQPTARKQKGVSRGCLKLFRTAWCKKCVWPESIACRPRITIWRRAFLPEWEQRFAVAPRNARNAHRRLGREQHLEEILSVRAGRRVAEDHTVRWDRKSLGLLREQVLCGTSWSRGRD